MDTEITKEKKNRPPKRLGSFSICKAEATVTVVEVELILMPVLKKS